MKEEWKDANLFIQQCLADGLSRSSNRCWGWDGCLWHGCGCGLGCSGQSEVNCINSDGDLPYKEGEDRDRFVDQEKGVMLRGRGVS